MKIRFLLFEGSNLELLFYKGERSDSVRDHRLTDETWTPSHMYPYPQFIDREGETTNLNSMLDLCRNSNHYVPVYVCKKRRKTK